MNMCDILGRSLTEYRSPPKTITELQHVQEGVRILQNFSQNMILSIKVSAYHALQSEVITFLSEHCRNLNIQFIELRILKTYRILL